MSADGSKVIYDLTSGIDFSRGKWVVDTIAMLMWNNDLEAFWTEQGDDLTFTPRYDVEIRLPRLDEKGSQLAREEIERDLERSDMLNSFNDHLNRVSQHSVSLGEVMLLGPIWAFALAHHKSKVQKVDELARLYNEMSSHISIVD